MEENKMSLTTTVINKVNKMNRAAKDASLGTLVANLPATGFTAGSTVVSSAEAAGSRVVIDTGLTVVTGFVGQDLRSGSPIVNAKWVSGSVAGTIVVTHAVGGSAIVLAANDTLSYVAW
jgi:hypothetical protein